MAGAAAGSARNAAAVLKGEAPRTVFTFTFSVDVAFDRGVQFQHGCNKIAKIKEGSKRSS